MLMGGGESHDCEAGVNVGGQPTDDNPAAAPRFGDSHRRETRMATVQDGDPTPRDGDDPIDRRREGNSQLSQRPVADINAGAATAESQAVKN